MAGGLVGRGIGAYTAVSTKVAPHKRTQQCRSVLWVAIVGVPCLTLTVFQEGDSITRVFVRVILCHATVSHHYP